MSLAAERDGAPPERDSARRLLRTAGFMVGLAFLVAAIVAMSINLVQEEIIGKFRQLAKDMGIIDDDEDDELNG